MAKNTDETLRKEQLSEARREAAKQASILQTAKNAVHGGPKDPKKDKRMGVGRGQKG